jgi:hypothetical protein
VAGKMEPDEFEDHVQRERHRLAINEASARLSEVVEAIRAERRDQRSDIGT